MSVYLEAGLLALMMIIGVICTYNDFRWGIIPNRILVWGLAVGSVFHTGFLVCGLSEYYPNWLLSMAIADVLALAMYGFQLWAAGDTKMFMVMYYMVPPMLLDAGSPVHGVIPYIFIFLPALVWVLIDSLIRLARKEPRKRKKVDIKRQLLNLGLVMVNTTTAYSVVFTVFNQFLIENEMLVTLALMIYAFFCGSNRFMKKWYVVLAHAIVLVATWILGTWRFIVPDWKSYLLLIAVFGVNQFVSLYNYQLIPASKAAKGMIPSAEMIIKFQSSRVHNLPQNPSEELNARISEEEANAIRRWTKTAKGEPEIWIVRRTPFAIMITLGFFLWICVRMGG